MEVDANIVIGQMQARIGLFARETAVAEATAATYQRQLTDATAEIVHLEQALATATAALAAANAKLAPVDQVEQTSADPTPAEVLALRV
jgi:hypothetical protein